MNRNLKLYYYQYIEENDKIGQNGESQQVIRIHKINIKWKLQN